ncbi:transporter substrate-binding domain-containing protein [Hahella sp. CR1]|uniref:substrate-binding periplasmic protein n=1 Tax=Hahella sp. CR1 TaxID=2992807 RepID=UPI00244160DF|nr:transporter substrate-binding domain-containing protein [Hahella sp. CR1]MDG9668913.1 transporter substrate-binding domain-containing protein [Hahella sp. CR1]
MPIYKYLSLVLAALWLHAGFASAEKPTLILGGPPWPPYLDEDQIHRGLATEIVESAFNKAGYPVQIKILPWPRLLRAAEFKEVDVMIGLWWTLEREEVFVFSSPYYVNVIGFAAPTESTFKPARLSDLTNARIGVRQGARFWSPFDFSTSLNKITVNTTESALNMTAVGRLDLTVEDVRILHSLINHDDRLSEHLKILPLPLVYRPLHMGVRRNLDNAETIVADFNAALAELLQSGWVATIYRRYGIAESPLDILTRTPPSMADE